MCGQFDVFIWEQYEARGGFDDYIGTYNTLEEAKEVFVKYDKISDVSYYCHIVKDRKIIVKGYWDDEYNWIDKETPTFDLFIWEEHEPRGGNNGTYGSIEKAKEVFIEYIKNPDVSYYCHIVKDHKIVSMGNYKNNKYYWTHDE